MRYDDYSASGRQRRIRRQQMENDIRTWTISPEAFTFWLRSFAPDDIVGQAGIPDKDPLAWFLDLRTACECVLVQEGEALYARNGVFSVSTRPEGVNLPRWVSQYLARLTADGWGRRVTAGDCLAALDER
jgi:hypothetical protein